MRAISSVFNVPIVLDRHNLDDYGIGTDLPVTASFQGISCRTALNLILKENDMTMVVDSEVVRITMPDALESQLITVVFVVPSLLNTKQLFLAVDQFGSGQDSDSLIEAIVTHIQLDSWTEVGGPGSILFTNNTLVVSQTPYVIQSVYDFLSTLSTQQFHVDISGGFVGAFLTRLYRVNILGTQPASRGRVAIQQAKAGIVTRANPYSTGNMLRTRPGSLPYSVTAHGTQASMTLKQWGKLIK